MNNKVDESFSAFLDGEASELDIQRLLKTLDAEPQAFGRWHELSKTQAVLQGDVVVDVAESFAPVQAQEAEQKTIIHWRKRLFQSGIAAAVALVVVTTVNLSEQKTPDTQVSVVISGQQNEADQALLAQQQFEAQQRLDLYIREHAEQASFTTGHVVIPAQLTFVEAQTE